MKRLVLAAAAAFVLTAPGVVEAQTQGQAVCKHPVSKEQMARAIETNNRRVLNIDCMKIVVEAIRQGHLPAGSDCKDLGAYVRKLALVDLPPGIKISFAWVTPQGELALTGFKREARPGEKGLLNNQTGIWFASTLCCNQLTDDGLPMPGANETVRPEPTTDLRSQMSAAAERAAAESERERETPRRGGNAFTRFVKEYKVPIIVGAVAAGTAAVLLGRTVKAEANPQVGNYRFGG